MTLEVLERLYETARDAGSLLILPHNNPDPDALASAVALRHLLAERPGVESHIAYRGLIGRAENKALVRYLDHPLRPLADSELRQSASIALVDVQPGAGNILLPTKANVSIVIDRHARREATSAADFADVRPKLGATSTILTEYLQTAGVEPAPPLSTALFYGIKTNTMSLGRDSSPADAAAYYYLQPRVDVEALAKIEHAQVPAHYFKSFDATLQAARVHDGVVIAYVGSMDYPDLAAEIADLLSRLEGSQWVICMGLYEDNLILSVRTRKGNGTEQLVQAIVGGDGTAGGHGVMAGGQIPLRGRDPKQIARQLSQRALRHLDVPPGIAGKPLI